MVSAEIEIKGVLALLNEVLGLGFGTEDRFLQRMKDWRMRRWSTTELQVRNFRKRCWWPC